MARVTYFVVLPYERSPKGRLMPGMAMPAKDAEHAKRVAERLAAVKPAVVAFSRSGDPDFGDWDDAVVLTAFGVGDDELTAA